MKDGLYQVTKYKICAGFIIQNGKVLACAPILRNRFNYWKTIAKEVKEKMSHTILHSFVLDLELNSDATEKQKEALLAELEDVCRRNDIVADVFDTSQEEV